MIGVGLVGWSDRGMGRDRVMIVNTFDESWDEFVKSIVYKRYTTLGVMVSKILQ